jgi:hypothetical protein
MEAQVAVVDNEGSEVSLASEEESLGEFGELKKQLAYFQQAMDQRV